MKKAPGREKPVDEEKEVIGLMALSNELSKDSAETFRSATTAETLQNGRQLQHKESFGGNPCHIYCS